MLSADWMIRASAERTASDFTTAIRAAANATAASVPIGLHTRQHEGHPPSLARQLQALKEPVRPGSRHPPPRGVPRWRPRISGGALRREQRVDERGEQLAQQVRARLRQLLVEETSGSILAPAVIVCPSSSRL